MSTVFLAAVAPDTLARAWQWARLNSTPGRVAMAVTLVVALTLPSALYMNERARRTELFNSYAQLATSSTAEISTLRHTMGSLWDEQVQLRHLLLDAGFAVHSGNELSIPVIATGYSSSVIETDSTPFITASNTRTRTGIIALSRELLTRYNQTAPVSFGDVVHISGLGEFIVEDSMNGRWKRRVDIWFPERPAAFRFGRRSVIMKVQVDAYDTAYNYTLPSNLVASGGPASIDSP